MGIIIRLMLVVTVVQIALFINAIYTNFQFNEKRRLDPDKNMQPYPQNDHLGSNVPTDRHNNNKKSEIRSGRLRSLPEVRHIVFLKVHKCASSTMLNIFYRFGFKRNLTFALPVGGCYIHFNIGGGSQRLLPSPYNSNYDILCNHVYYFKRSTVAKYFPPDTVYLAIVREPFQRLYSAFNYYRNVLQFPNIKKIKGNNPFVTYITRPGHFESEFLEGSPFNNKMVREFGFPFRDLENMTKFGTFLSEIDKRFHLVMVKELFDESLVLVRRLLNWSMKEIIYRSQNSYPYKPVTESNITVEIKPYLATDYALYNHFLMKLKRKIASEGQDFRDEVSYFRRINSKAAVFCNSGSGNKTLVFYSNGWHGDFSISDEDCRFMNMSELDFLSLIRNTHIEKLKTAGVNVTTFI